MKLVLAEPKYLKESISIISELVNEARFKITPNGIELVAMDPANVAMVVFRLLSSSFVDYKVAKEVKIAINLSNLKQILRRTKPTDMLSLELDSENRLKIQIKGETVKTFSVPIIDFEEKEQKIPELNFPVDIQMNSALLNELVEDADTVAESAIFSVDKNNLNIHAEGDLSKAHIEVKAGDDIEIKTSASDPIKAKYSVEYLKKMIGGSKLADKVTIQFNNDYPLKLAYTVVDKMSLSFILAPRVEND